MDISRAENLFREDRINEPVSSKEGLLYLKLKSLNRSHFVMLATSFVCCYNDGSNGLMK